MIADDRVAAVTLTGSERAGRAVAAHRRQPPEEVRAGAGRQRPVRGAAQRRSDAAVATAVKARMVNNGQSCIAAKRFIVADAIYDRFRDAVRGGDGGPADRRPERPGDRARAAGHRRHPRRTGGAGRRSVAAGARLLTGRHRCPNGPASSTPPTVLAESPPEGSPAAREELFGPVATLWRVRDAGEAIALANDTVFGLGASVWTRDRRRGGALPAGDRGGHGVHQRHGRVRPALSVRRGEAARATGASWGSGDCASS